MATPEHTTRGVLPQHARIAVRHARGPVALDRSRSALESSGDEAVAVVEHGRAPRGLVYWRRRAALGGLGQDALDAEAKVS